MIIKHTPTIIFGSGGASREVYYLIKQINQSNGYINYDVLGFIENETSMIGRVVCDNLIVVTCDKSLKEFLSVYERVAAFIPVGDPEIKLRIHNSLKCITNIYFPNIIHPSAIYDANALKMKEGNIICAGNIIGSSLSLGSFNLINRSCTIGHDIEVGDYNTINPMSALSGDVIIGNKNLVGSGAIILQGLEIGDNITIGAGAVLTKNARNGETLVGIPAKKVDYPERKSQKVYIIAEAGVNHNGSLHTAKELALEAKKAGADAVKFQTFKTENCISQFAKKADYQKELTDDQETQFEMIEKLELSYEDFSELNDYCNQIDIEFISTPFDIESIDFLNGINMHIWKIPSGEITNLPYLIKIAETHKPVIMSTGMCEIKEIDYAINVLKEYGAGDIALLHCNTEYPTPYEDANIKAILTMKEVFNLEVGYSDHTIGVEVPIAAVALGATIIEKHFTLDKNMEGPDHKSSMEPAAFKTMISSIRKVEISLGTGVKAPTKSELKNKEVARKSIVAMREIKKGEVLTEESITIKRPGNGISPTKWFEILGQIAVRDFKKDELIEI